MPFIFPHLALMPDAHLGKGATVGSVIPTLGAIMPAAVGVDIGCGMIAVRTQFTAEDIAGAATWPPARGDRARHPAVGRHVQQPPSTDAETSARIAELEQHDGADSAEAIAPNWRLQLGSLGSGNHFIEVSLDEARPGLAVPALRLPRRRQQAGQRHIKIAQELCSEVVDHPARP